MAEETVPQEGSKHEFPCEKCGAKLKFKPGLDSISCEYCGHTQAVKVDESKTIDEHDYLDALENPKTIAPSKMVHQGKEIQCNGCGARTVITEQSDHCAFCGSPIVMEVKSEEDIIAPESVLPFKVAKNEAKTKFMDWVSGLWFAPNDLSKRAKTQGMDGVYLPYWTYDSITSTNYVGERGEWYYVTETYTNSDGETETRQVRHTRWYPAAGNVKMDFDDILVCASKSLPQEMVDDLEPWDLKELKPYEPAFLSGFLTERYKINLKEGFEIGQKKMDEIIYREICSDIGGDEQRVHSYKVNHRNVTFKHTLLPLWISSFKYSEKIYRFVINARTGEVSGERPYSWIKISLAVIAGLLLAFGIYYLTHKR